MKMRKILAALVAAVMVISMIPVMAVTTSAADVEGDWDTFRNGEEYTPAHEEDGYKPAPGYQYTDDGFQTIRPDYTNTSPYFNVLTKEKQSLKDGVYLEMRVDEYSYTGDHWLGFSIWSSTELAPGNTNYGSGWLAMVRAPGNGVASSAQSSITLKRDEEAGVQGYFNVIGTSAVAPTLDDEGREIYTMEITYSNDIYNISICGVPVAGATQITDLLNQLDENGDFHVGVTMYSTEKDGNATLTILKYGTSQEDAETPVGTDTKEPEPNINVIADIADPSTVETNMPALIFDASIYSEPPSFGCSISALGDNAFRCVGDAESAYFTWKVKKNLSYDASDFPVIALMLRSFDGTGGSCFFSAGDIVSNDPNYLTSFGLWDEGSMEFESEEGYYNMTLMDLTGLWEGRINAFRFDFSGIDTSDEDFASWDVCWIGAFRSVEEAQAYTTAWATEKGLEIGEETTEEPTDAPTEKPTEEPTEEATNAPANGDNEAKTDAETKADDSGCGSVIGSAAVVLAAVAAAFVMKKRH